MKFTLSQHAEIVIRERGLSLLWIELALSHPGKIVDDADDASLRHALVEIPENGHRVLRVIYNQTKNPPHIVTAYFDRKQKGKL